MPRALRWSKSSGDPGGASSPDGSGGAGSPDGLGRSDSLDGAVGSGGFGGSGSVGDSDDPFAGLNIPAGYRLEEIEGEYVLVETGEGEDDVELAIDCEHIATLVGAHSYYVYDRSIMTDTYAHWAFLAAEDDRVVTFVECVREDSRVYPRPLAASSLKNPPFRMTDEDIAATWGGRAGVRRAPRRRAHRRFERRRVLLLYEPSFARLRRFARRVGRGGTPPPHVGGRASWERVRSKGALGIARAGVRCGYAPARRGIASACRGKGFVLEEPPRAMRLRTCGEGARFA